MDPFVVFILFFVRNGSATYLPKEGKCAGAGKKIGFTALMFSLLSSLCKREMKIIFVNWKNL